MSAGDQHGLEPFFDQLLTNAGDCREAGAQRRGDLAVAPSFAALPCICFQQHARPGQLSCRVLAAVEQAVQPLSLFPAELHDILLYRDFTAISVAITNRLRR